MAAAKQKTLQRSMQLCSFASEEYEALGFFPLHCISMCSLSDRGVFALHNVIVNFSRFALLKIQADEPQAYNGSSQLNWCHRLNILPLCSNKSAFSQFYAITLNN